MPAASRDPYAALGLSRSADESEIKRAYRELAQRHHPDRNPDDDAAEERFKEVSAAYAVLSDAQRRKDYDEFGEIALDPNFDAERARAAHAGPFGSFGQARGHADFGSLFDDFFREPAGGFSRRSQARPIPGRDREVALELDLEEASSGCERRVSLRGNASGKTSTLRVRIPAGTRDGGRIRLPGKGDPGQNGGPPGDLYCRVRLRPHRIFEVDGYDLSLKLPIRVGEAMNGARIEVPTLEGRVSLTIPAGSQGGTRLRVRGKGLHRPGEQAAGDLYISLEIHLPSGESEEAREHAEALDALSPKDLRDDLFR